MLRLLCVQIVCLCGVAYADSLGYNYDPLPSTLDGLSNILGAFPIPNTITYDNVPRQIRAEPSEELPQAAIEAIPTNAFQSRLYEVPPAVQAPIQTEFISYTAPDDYHDSQSGELQHLAGVLRPQRVVFIRSPETNIFSITAKQLAQQNPLAIYVLARQTNADSLAEQFREIQAQNAQQPEVQFVKYRTAEDLAHAQQTIRADYEKVIAGPSSSYEEAIAPVIDLRSAKRTVGGGARTPGYQSYEQTAELAAPSEQYLPLRDY